MSRDIKMFNACNHIVDNISYDLQLCPKCFGKGYYFDISFDNNGQAITAEDDIKLQQEMLKVIIDTKFKNLYHTKWGSQLNSLIGSKNNAVTKNKIKILAQQAEEYLQKVQLAEANIHNNLNEKEIIQEIISVNIDAMGPTGYLVTISVKNMVNDIWEQTIRI